jgi:molybdate transport system substrate-binding protein
MRWDVMRGILRAKVRDMTTGARRRLLRALAPSLVAALLLSAGACKRTGSAPAVREDRVVVFAASSLRDAFMTMRTDFQWANPGVEVTFNFAGTQELRAQLEQGAAVDVFASADERHMAELVRTSRVSAPVSFARNEPVVVVAKGSAKAVRTFADLPSVDRIVVGVPEVPIGRYTAEILDRASSTLGADFRRRVEAKVVSRELNVRQVLAKVSLGEAQAGIGYASDARAGVDRVTVVSIPSAVNVIAVYPIAVASGAAHPGLARTWIAYVLSDKGQLALRDAGFLAPAGDRPAP